MDERNLWDVFTRSGAVEDYLRYRGINMPSARQEESRGDERQTAPYDRRADYS